jgi:hypothetical protein
MQISAQQGSRGCPVDVVVRKDADPLAGGDRRRQALDRDIQIQKMRRVGQSVANARLEKRGRPICGDAARSQNAADDLRQVQALTDRQRRRLVILPQLPGPQTRSSAPAQAGKCGTTALLRCR